MKFKEEVVKIPLCEKCEQELLPQHPHFKFGNNYYCGDCALETGKISLEEYKKIFLYFIDPDLLKDYTLGDALKDIKENRSSK